MQSITTNFILISAVVYLSQVNSDDPCDTTEYIDNWQRSVAFGTDATQLWDNILAEGWYRVTSGAGGLMPTECPVGGLRCNTAKPIYLYTDDLPAGEEAYPAVGVTVTRTAYASNYDGNCKHTEYEIQIKNCDGYYVYFLKSIKGGCTSAYCFGDQLPCKNGETSENGFLPGCETFPNVTVSPYVNVTLTETETVTKWNVTIVNSKATFECHADDLQDKYKYKTRCTQSTKDNIKQNSCLLVLLNGVPDYQVNEKECVNGITVNGIVFTTDRCGIKFSHSNWKEKQTIKIFGQTDQLVNVQDRIIFLRLYNADDVEPTDPILYWKNIHLPDIKVYVKDADILTLGKSCYSHNDPHMRTFDQSYYELQIHNGLTEGEYIMYKHDRLPLQVSAYYQKCYTRILCNCGIAVRSSDSLFVANYCETNYKGQRKTNRYMSQRLCDDQSLIVTKKGTTYEITLPTGTKVTFNYGYSYVDGINIIPSVLDTGMTKGLCGIYNGNADDDFMPRDELTAVSSIETFASSWKVTGDYANETLFDPDGVLTEIEYSGQEYCTCVSPDDDYLHGSPEFKCELTAAMKPCRETKTTPGVYTADCKILVTNYERGDEEPPSYPMIADDNIPIILTEKWQNDWTEASAREHCIYHFETAPAFNVCSEYVPSVDKIPFIKGCIADIKSTGGDDWLKVTIRNFASVCLQESKRLEILTVTNSTNSTGSDKPIAFIIEESVCPNDCFNQGECVEGECTCNDGHYGDSCSLTCSNAPTIIKNAFEDLCDSSQKPCRTFIIPGSDFINGTGLTCKYTSMSLKSNGSTTLLEVGDMFTYPGTYANSLFMYCKLPGLRKKRSVETTCYIKVDSESEMKLLIIIPIVATAVIVLIFMAVLICKWKQKPKESYFRNSTLSLSTTSQQTAPNSHFMDTENIVLTDKLPSESDLNNIKFGRL